MAMMHFEWPENSATNEAYKEALLQGKTEEEALALADEARAREKKRREEEEWAKADQSVDR
jgi:hypothetical protein